MEKTFLFIFCFIIFETTALFDFIKQYLPIYFSIIIYVQKLFVEILPKDKYWQLQSVKLNIMIISMIRLTFFSYINGIKLR